MKNSRIGEPKETMEIPTYQELMLLLMKVMARENRPLRHSEYTDLVADEIALDEEAKNRMLPKGRKTYIFDRVTWAGWYLRAAGLLERPQRGWLQITEKGKALVAENPPQINNKFLERYPEYVERVIETRKAASAKEQVESGTSDTEATPEERMEAASSELLNSLVSELLETMQGMNAYQFEQVVLDLLVAMGYGGSNIDAAQLTSKSNDEGIDGIINEDALGLDVIYLQAKRWSNPVGRKEIQSFVGALSMKQATKGVFITTSSFNSNATDCAEQVPHKIILIDGDRLARLMIEHNIGVTTKQSFQIKRIDSDYFVAE